MANSRTPVPARTYRTPGISNVESLEGYSPGGYCPVNVGDKLGGNPKTYTILHKLGFGPSSTVWLARCEDTDASKAASHALKILRADLSAPGKHPELEISSQRLELEGRTSHHPCLLAYAVNYLHAFDVCHSDLSPRHVLFKIPNAEYISTASLQNTLGPVVSERIKLADGKPPSKHSPKEVTQPASFSGLSFNSLKEIALIGFGKAFPEITPPPTLQCPLIIFPSEVLFGYPASNKSDVWQLACLMFVVHTGTFPFQTEPFYGHLVWHITKSLGPIPSQWAGRYRWDKYKSLTCPGETYGRDLAASFDKAQPTKSLENRLAEGPHLSSAERKKLAALLGSILVWEPGLRPTSGLVLSVL
ncbi:hypothetical protein C8A01DRAFT_48150 [Parachaetomium inaequale]|uniref:Protein kinase domain-containing protein n=1 Tax=Parachaetomium inaequale TaxID=2588326 RepID=A0AAN6PC44_9PEZI|nr:hypothetical protein C8A01DRAFT_48150 [Parachaetomium inaequale]